MISNTTLEQLQLFEHVDYNTNIMLVNDSLLIDGNVHIFLSSECQSKWISDHKEEMEGRNITFACDRLGKVVDYVIQNEDVNGLIIDGLAPISLYITHNDLQPLKDLIDSFCIMYASVCNKIEKVKAANLLANKDIYFIGEMPAPKKGSIFGVATITIKENNDEHESIKTFLTKEHAEKYNTDNRPVSKCKLHELAFFYQGMFRIIIEPHCNYWIELLPEDIINQK